MVYQGWPNPQQLASALAAGAVHISVFPRPGDRVTSVTSGEGEWIEVSNDGTTGSSMRELRRQARTFQVTVWANCFDHRDPVAKALDSALAAISRLVLPDTSIGVLSYVNSTQDDDQQKQGVYRRDLFYAVDYATTQTENEYAIKEIDTTLRRVADISDPASPTLGPTITVALTNTSITTTIS